MVGCRRRSGRMGLDNATSELLIQMLGLRQWRHASYFRAAYAAFRAGIAWFGQAASVGKPEQGAPSAVAPARLLEPP